MLFLLFCFVSLHNALALSPDDNITPQFEELTRQLETLAQAATPRVIRAYREKSSKTLMSLSSEERKKGNDYLAKLEEWEAIAPIAQLKADLIANYLSMYPQTDPIEKAKLDEETNRLAITLIEGIKKLRENYKISAPPIVHNLFIDLGLKKRGACKHWAEDLLNLINTLDHPHFTSLWAEAHPHKISEHNVAVLVPRGADFKEGLLIDPWRKGGKPFWIQVKKDNHPWNIWSGYEPQ